MSHDIKLAAEDVRRDVLMARVDQIRYATPEVRPENSMTIDVRGGLTVPIVNAKHPFYREHTEPFDLERYQYPRPPIDLGHSRLAIEGMAKSVCNVLRMPIKQPGTPLRLPTIIEPVWDLVKRVAQYEAGFNERYAECHAHVTVDRGVVEAGTPHRYPGFHGDGVQGSKFSQEKYIPIEHSYVVASSPPTEFCLQPFFFQHLNDGRHNIFHEMEVQAREQNVYRTIPWHLYLIDPYMVHRTPRVEETVDRVFVRITFAYNELANPHNTPSPLFPEQVYADRHDIRKFLTLYPGEVPWEMYGLSSGPRRVLP